MSLRYSVYQELAVSFLECLQSMHQERRGEEEKKEKRKKKSFAYSWWIQLTRIRYMLKLNKKNTWTNNQITKQQIRVCFVFFNLNKNSVVKVFIRLLSCGVSIREALKKGNQRQIKTPSDWLI